MSPATQRAVYSSRLAVQYHAERPSELARLSVKPTGTGRVIPLLQPCGRSMRHGISHSGTIFERKQTAPAGFVESKVTTSYEVLWPGILAVV